MVELYKFLNYSMRQVENKAAPRLQYFHISQHQSYKNCNYFQITVITITKLERNYLFKILYLRVGHLKLLKDAKKKKKKIDFLV